MDIKRYKQGIRKLGASRKCLRRSSVRIQYINNQEKLQQSAAAQCPMSSSDQTWGEWLNFSPKQNSIDVTKSNRSSSLQRYGVCNSVKNYKNDPNYKCKDIFCDGGPKTDNIFDLSDDEHMYDDLRVDINKLLDDSAASQDETIKMKYLPNMRDTGKKDFLPYSINIPFSIWSKEAADEDRRPYYTNFTFIVGNTLLYNPLIITLNIPNSRQITYVINILRPLGTYSQPVDKNENYNSNTRQEHCADGSPFMVSTTSDKINYKRFESGSMYDYNKQKKYYDYKSIYRLCDLDAVLQHVGPENNNAGETDDEDAEVAALNLGGHMNDSLSKELEEQAIDSGNYAMSSNPKSNTASTLSEAEPVPHSSDICELLDDSQTLRDEVLEMMYWAYMQDTGKKRFLPYSTNIISSTWSNPEPVKNSRLFDIISTFARSSLFNSISSTMFLNTNINSDNLSRTSDVERPVKLEQNFEELPINHFRPIKENGDNNSNTRQEHYADASTFTASTDSFKTNYQRTDTGDDRNKDYDKVWQFGDGSKIWNGTVGCLEDRQCRLVKWAIRESGLKLYIHNSKL